MEVGGGRGGDSLGVTEHEVSVSVTLAVSSVSAGHLGHGERRAYILIMERRSNYTNVKEEEEKEGESDEMKKKKKKKKKTRRRRSWRRRRRKKAKKKEKVEDEEEETK